MELKFWFSKTKNVSGSPTQDKTTEGQTTNCQKTPQRVKKMFFQYLNNMLPLP